MPFRERWRVEGTLTTASPLHVGDGETIIREPREQYANLWRKVDRVWKATEIGSVYTDCRTGACIPGSTLKGNLRAWLEEHGRLTSDEQRRLKLVMGFQESGPHSPGEDPSEGGQAEFHDARAADTPASWNPGRFWCRERLTCVATSVAIDRWTRTASEKKLFYVEFVPEGITFDVRITGGLQEEDVEMLLLGLEGFNERGEGARVTLGAGTGDGWGRLRWEPGDLCRLRRDDVRASIGTWLASPAGMRVGYESAKAVSAEKQAMLARVANRMGGTDRKRPVMAVELCLQCEGPFLVNDTSQTGKGEELPDHAPLRRSRDDRALLPASSMRGALRSQAERIVRTLAKRDQAAWFPHEVLTLDNGDPKFLEKLCPVSVIFGAPGWRAPLKVSDFVSDQALTEIGKMPKQDFLAIDRFTGGGAKHLKFDARYCDRPTLRGRLELDLSVVAEAGGAAWCLALLAFVLRDLAEGDIPLGFGAAKGYGACRLSDFQLTGPEWNELPEAFQGDWSKDDYALAVSGKFGDENVQLAVMCWFDELKKRATDHARRQEEQANGSIS